MVPHLLTLPDLLTEDVEDTNTLLQLEVGWVLTEVLGQVYGQPGDLLNAPAELVDLHARILGQNKHMSVGLGYSGAGV